jgi:hypothetical protein
VGAASRRDGAMGLPPLSGPGAGLASLRPVAPTTPGTEEVVPGAAPCAPGILTIPGKKPRLEQRPRRRSHSQSPSWSPAGLAGLRRRRLDLVWASSGWASSGWAAGLVSAGVAAAAWAGTGVGFCSRPEGGGAMRAATSGSRRPRRPFPEAGSAAGAADSPLRGQEVRAATSGSPRRRDLGARGLGPSASGWTWAWAWALGAVRAGGCGTGSARAATGAAAAGA